MELSDYISLPEFQYISLSNSGNDFNITESRLSDYDIPSININLNPNSDINDPEVSNEQDNNINLDNNYSGKRIPNYSLVNIHKDNDFDYLKSHILKKNVDIDNISNNLKSVLNDYASRGVRFRITDGYNNKSHNPNSWHYKGEAIDITPIEGEDYGTLLKNMRSHPDLIQKFKDFGYKLHDERKNTGKVWSGSHFHIGKDSKVDINNWDIIKGQKGIKLIKNESDVNESKIDNLAYGKSGIKIKDSNKNKFLKLQLGGYVVKSGDNLKKIASDNRIKYDYLLSNNPQIKNPNKVNIGDTIKLYGDKTEYKGNIFKKLLNIESDDDILPNGYTRKEHDDYQRQLIISGFERLSKSITNKPKINNYKPDINFVIKHEGFRNKLYDDGKGYKTIGHGLRNPEALKMNTISKEESLKFVKQHVDKEVLSYLQKESYWNKLNNNQKNALVSLVYNVGWNKFKKESPNLQKALNNNNFKEAVKHIDHGMNDEGFGGLKNRRQDEQKLFTTSMKQGGIALPSFKYNPLVNNNTNLNKSTYNLTDIKIKSPIVSNYNNVDEQKDNNVNKDIVQQEEQRIPEYKQFNDMPITKSTNTDIYKTKFTTKDIPNFTKVMSQIYFDVLDEMGLPKTNLLNLVRQSAVESNYGTDPRGNGYNLGGIKNFTKDPNRGTVYKGDNISYLNFKDLKDYVTYKVKLLNTKYNAIDAPENEFVDRLHGNNPTKQSYSASRENYFKVFKNMKTLDNEFKKLV